MSPLPKLELQHTLMSEDDALRFLEGHRISRGGRTMDPKAQLVGEFVKSIRVPGYFPPLPELRQQLTMVSLDEPAPPLARLEDIRIPGPLAPYPRDSTKGPATEATPVPLSCTFTAAAACRAISRLTTGYESRSDSRGDQTGGGGRRQRPSWRESLLCSDAAHSNSASTCGLPELRNSG